VTALRRCGAAGFALAFVLLSGCVTQPPARTGTQVILLPQADGTPSSVIVSTAAGESVIATPYQRATVREGQKAAPVIDQTSEARTRDAYKAIIDATPPPPATYVVYFQTGRTLLTPDSQAVITRALEETLKRNGAEIVITGHTDTRASAASNEALSLRRAEEMRDLFVQRGFAARRITTVGLGERQLAVQTPDNVDEPRNRRVEIQVR
jgi:OOP family OmpA-OmpF porin